MAVGSPRARVGQWVGVAVEEGCWGSSLARSRVVARCTDGGGSTAFCGGEDDGAGEPANEATRHDVKTILEIQGSAMDLQW